MAGLPVLCVLQLGAAVAHCGATCWYVHFLYAYQLQRCKCSGLQLLSADALPSEDQIAAIVAAMDSHWLHFTPPQRERCAAALQDIRIARAALSTAAAAL